VSGKFNFEIEQQRFDAVPVPTEADHNRAKLERLRDEFAMAALTGMISAVDPKSEGSQAIKPITEAAYDFADAMLKARETKP
jgi:hypothetical protein